MSLHMTEAVISEKRVVDGVGEKQNIALRINHADGVLHGFKHTRESFVCGSHSFLRLTDFSDI